MNSQFLTYLEESSNQFIVENVFIDDIIWINDKDDIEIPDFRKVQNLQPSYIREPSKNKVKYILDVSFDATESMAALFIKKYRYLKKLTFVKETWILLLSLSQSVEKDLVCDYIEFTNAREFLNVHILKCLFQEDFDIAEKHLKDIKLRNDINIANTHF